MNFVLRLLPLLAALLASLALVIAASGFAGYYYLRPALPSVAEMRDIPLQIPLRIYSRDGRLMQQIGEKRRTPVAFDDIPPIVVRSFLAAEDDRFFEHPGFDYQGILRAALKLAMTGSRAQGGSTITQQLAREYFLTRDRTFIRKAKELILAVQIENAFTKQEILELYLNKIFLGQRSYGVAAAAQVYFGKSLEQLTVSEAATIAGLPAAPSRLNPVTSPANARERRAYVLRRMVELNYIDAARYRTALDTPMESHLHGPEVELEAPYIAEMARAEMLRRFGTDAYTQGYQVITTVDSELQRAADRALRTALLQYDRRHGFRGAIDRLDLNAMTGADDNTDARLQERLSTYPRFDGLRVAVVTSVNDAGSDSTAELFVHDTGRLTLPWQQIRWKRHINDNVISGDPENASDLFTEGAVVYLVATAQGWRLAQIPEVQGAFVSLDPHDGAVVALVGGFDYGASKYNRAVQTRRQPGSSFKPFVYSAALENGFTASSIINDAPIVVTNTGQEEAWRPENHSNRFYGPTRLREGLVRSMNLVSLRLLRAVGIGNALEHLRHFGLPDTATPRDLSLALGSGGASPLQMAQAYAVLASGGYAVDSYVIERVLDADGNVLFAAQPDMVCNKCRARAIDGPENAGGSGGLDGTNAPAENRPDPAGASADATPTDSLLPPELPDYESVASMIAAAGSWRPDASQAPNFWANRNQAPRAIPEQNAYIVYDMMRDVIQRGTGRRARDLGRTDIAGKTGTSNNRRDAWFSGFNGDIVGVAWVGFDDDSRSLGAGEEGGRTALPIWKDFMTVALANSPPAELELPEGIVTARISPDTGLAARVGEPAMFEIFRAGNEPAPADDELDYGGSDIFVGEDNAEAIF